MRKRKNYTQADVRDWAMWTFAFALAFIVIDVVLRIFK